MSDEYLINSHKLHLHVDRVNDWLKGENVYPIYMEVGLTRACNHRCVFCAFDYTGFEPVFIDTKRLCATVSELAGLGVKSIMYAGEGEPLAHKDIIKIVQHTHKAGIDVAMESNGVLFNKEKIEGILPHMEWIRVSLSAGTPKSYAYVHGTRKEDFNRVLDNLRKMADYKRRHKLKVTIGVQMILLPETMAEPVLLARQLRQAGVDYFSVKPYIQHLKSWNKRSVDYSQIEAIRKKILPLQTDDFRIIIREAVFSKLKQGRGYKTCLGLPFFAEITSGGNVYCCGPFLYQDKFCYGNIYGKTFKQIWNGPRRKKLMNYILKHHDVKKCMLSCRLDEINKYLWQIKNPPPHVNFI